MANSYGPITISTTGVGKTFTGFGFQPNVLRFRIGAKSTSSPVIQESYGSVDSGGYQTVLTWYGDSMGFQSKTSNTKCISHWERIGGVMTEVLAATFNSFTADGFKLDVTVANANYKVHVEAEN